jgi:hypothetical protein
MSSIEEQRRRSREQFKATREFDEFGGSLDLIDGPGFDASHTFKGGKSHCCVEPLRKQNRWR